MKQIIFTFIVFTFFSSSLHAQPGVEQVGWLPYWGEFQTVEVSGTTALVLNNYGLLSFDVSDPFEPELLDSYPIAEGYWSYQYGRDIQIIGDIANVQYGSLYRFDISDLNHLVLLPELPPAPQHYGTAFIQIEDHLYTAGHNQLYVIDVSDPREPVVIDSTLLVGPIYRLIEHDSLLIAESYCYERIRLQLTFFSLAEPDSPEVVGSYRSEDFPHHPHNCFSQFVGNLYYVITPALFGSDYLLECIDFTNPTEPFRRWTWEWDRIGLVGSIGDLLAIDQHDGDEYFWGLYSTEEPDTLIEVARIPTPTWSYEISIQDDILYASTVSGLYCFDIEDMNNTSLLGRFRSRSCRDDVAKIGDYVTVSLNDSTIRVISVENPATPREVSCYQSDDQLDIYCTWTNPESNTYTVARHSPYILTFLQLNENEELEMVGSLDLDLEELTYFDHFDVTSWDDGVVAIMSQYNEDIDATTSYFMVVSLEDPSNPELIGSMSDQQGGNYMGFGYEVVVNGEYAYIPGDEWIFDSNGSYIVSIEDPTDPRIIAYAEDHTFNYPLAIENDLLVAGSELFSIENPIHPERITEIDHSLQYPYTVSIQHGLVAVNNQNGANNFHLYNVRNPEEPFLIDGLNLPDPPIDIHLEDGYFYALESSGIEILQYTGADDAPQIEHTLPMSVQLLGPYPNPFNSQARLEYILPTDSHVRLVVTDLSGREVIDVQDEDLNAGQHQVMIDASDLSSGIYFARLEAGNEVKTTKLVCVK
ncbi:MAG: T9SS type A sorting domain-containing protein [Candidatus Electryoneaceae bacterium]|nr:T9SS type A sorting domain-containing protein [Candidatus Electryoneaceae bacterium]